MTVAKNEADSGASHLHAKLDTHPNNCEACDHKQIEHSGWCYMFRDEPTDVCMCHSGRRPLNLAEQILMAQQVYGSIPEWAKPVPNA